MKYLSLLAVFLCSLSSCAYMQTNKSVAEIGAHYVGAELTTDSLALYSRAGEWYLAAPKVLLKRHYPIIYDSIYLNRNNDPTESTIKKFGNDTQLFMPISAGTAQVLMRPDGYASLSALASESSASGKAAIDSLPGGKRYVIKAHLDTKGKDASYYISQREPEKSSYVVLILSQLDKYSVDVAGTVVYNVALPFMAPFRFFSDFLADD